jgi:hypothetical protein
VTSATLLMSVVNGAKMNVVFRTDFGQRLGLRTREAAYSRFGDAVWISNLRGSTVCAGVYGSLHMYLLSTRSSLR